MNKKIQSFIQLGLLGGILIFLNVLGNAFYQYFDLTEEKRFTLTQPTVNLLENLDEIVSVTILLEGDFPAGFKRLQNAVIETLEDFHAHSSLLEYTFEDPSEGTVEQVNQIRAQLKEQGIKPINLIVKGTDERKELLIYPYAILNYKGRSLTIDLLEDEVPGMPQQIILNNSISLLEYKLSNAIQKLQIVRKPALVYIKGHGELHPLQLADLTNTLRPYYDLGFLDLDSTYQINPEIKVVMVARPRAAFSERDKFVLDQYIMNGGKVIWMIDRLNVNLDSLKRNPTYIPTDYELNLDDMLYKYGARIQPNVIADMRCTPIPQVVDSRGTIELFDYYYHLAVAPQSNHPIVKSINLVNMRYPSKVEPIRTKTDVKSTVLLSTSEYSKEQFSPVRLNFDILRYEPDTAWFGDSHLPLALLLEGEFPSLYENRVTEEMKKGLIQLGSEFKKVSVPTRMIVIADGDIAKNPIDPQSENYLPLGYNRYARFQFANKDFLINAIEYLMDDKGVIEARSKEVKLRMLNKTKAKNERIKWRVINIVIPLLFLLLFGFLYNYLRKRRYAV